MNIVYNSQQAIEHLWYGIFVKAIGCFQLKLLSILYFDISGNFFFRTAIETFRSFLTRTKSNDIIDVLTEEECWEKFEQEEDYPEGFTILTR